jgi:DMSO/TMAO reductase YedYZ heme-binding membrane subunit
MPFEERFNQIVKKSTPVSPLRMWINTLILSIGVFVFGSLYLFARRGSFDLYIANKVFATTSLVLIGLSFALSGLCYFWDFVDTKIVYRKVLGLVGFYYSLVHVFVTLFLLPNKFPLPSWIMGHIPTVVFATLGLIIFIVMAIASDNDVMHELGSKSWRRTMRAGYIAYIFIIIHFTLLKYKGWMSWFNTKEPFLPPLSLLEIIFAVAVIGIRIALEISIRKRRATQSSDSIKSQDKAEALPQE